MIVVTVDFPDERVGVDHMHHVSRDEVAAQTWVALLRAVFGDIQAEIQPIDGGWTCPACRWSTRRHRRTMNAPE